MSRSLFTLILSIAVSALAVNAQSENLSSVNKNKSDNAGAGALKDSVKDTNAELPKLISIVMEKGNDGKLPEHLARAVGPGKEVPVKDIAIKGQIGQMRMCLIAYDTSVLHDSESPKKRPVCLYLTTKTKANREGEARIFRISLDGHLEKAVSMHGEYDQNGKPIRGSGIISDQNINSVETKDAFNAEMKFWLKDWLKSQPTAKAAL